MNGTFSSNKCQAGKRRSSLRRGRRHIQGEFWKCQLGIFQSHSEYLHLLLNSFGVPAVLLELVPVAGVFFAFTNTVGAALWAADLEQHNTTAPGLRDQAKKAEWDAGFLHYLGAYSTLFYWDWLFADTPADNEVSQALGYTHYACECTYRYPWKPPGAKGDLLEWTWIRGLGWYDKSAGRSLGTKTTCLPYSLLPLPLRNYERTRIQHVPRHQHGPKA